MHGIVSILDDKHYQLVENLWAELERKFAVRGVYITPYPHFSYQIAQGYNVEQLEPILQRFASNQAAFQVKTSAKKECRAITPELISCSKPQFAPLSQQPGYLAFGLKQARRLWQAQAQALPMVEKLRLQMS